MLEKNKKCHKVTRSQGHNKIFKKFLRIVRVALCLCVLVTIGYKLALALDLGKIRQSYISGDYKAAIKEGEKMMAHSSHNQPGLDELYYILGLSYLKDGNYLRASDIFEIIINEFKSSLFINEAKMGLADVDYFKADYQAAERKYLELLDSKPAQSLKAQLYYRLSEASAKLGKIEETKLYQEKLKKEVPLNMEPKLVEPVVIIKPPAAVDPAAADVSSVINNSHEIYYSVQVGFFSNSVNAGNLSAELIKKGYPSFVEESKAEDKPSYRVRVGKFNSRQKAVDLEARLAKEGYPTKIYP